tara:strand:+ start:1421 stop:1939 length:519 start_codon:yes stop_codon:yes gene_type:complete
MEKLLYVPNLLLRQKAKKISYVGEEDIIIANKMKEIMINASGVGLAANQIGILKKIVTIFFIDKENKEEIKYTLFNPEIISYSEEKIIMEEGCLSIPEQYAEIERPKDITLKYINEKNEIIKKNLTGIESRILQHEIDHLSGKLFFDYLSSLKRNIMIKKVQKYLKTKMNEK